MADESTIDLDAHAREIADVVRQARIRHAYARVGAATARVDQARAFLHEVRGSGA